MEDFEKLGAFYLGRLMDPQDNTPQPDLVLYDSKDLTTHAVCVGMTGSGKTGLCLSLLEEAAIDGIPVIAIDPKGDLGNLLLTFPELRPADFRPWVDESEAARNGLTADQFAAQTAKIWREGLAEWGQDGSRIARLRQATEMTIYTPGSNAGLPLSVLRSFQAPAAEIVQDEDALREHIGASAAGLLTLLGIDADPIRSREHILLSNLLDRAWREGRDVSMPDLIRDIQSPPMDKLGFMDLETVYPQPDRIALSMQLNNLLASPSFAAWMEGEPLQVKRLLYTPQGRPRLSIVSIAHLSESERMFFVTILLNEVLTWVRSQPGTSSLRAVLYMDEVFGYFPPTANPPSKRPMLTLLKQARAYGLGIVLATQNPVDLDYKGLSNTGTWFLGRLQTERDKARVLEGLEGASTTTGAKFNRQEMEATLARLGKRVFLMNNVHEDEPVVFRTRWALSYLRGPLTKSQIQTLMASRSREPQKDDVASAKVPEASKPANSTASPTTASRASRPVDRASDAATITRPVVPPKAGECFLLSRGGRREGDRLVYLPALLGVAQLHFVRATYKVDLWQTNTLFRPVDEDELDDVWPESVAWDQGDLELAERPEEGIEFGQLPSVLTAARRYATWGKNLKDYLYQTKTIPVWRCVELKQYSQPPEAEDDFRIRLTQRAHERRDLQVEKLRKRYASKAATLKDRLRRAQQRVQRETEQYSQQKYQSVISFGSTVLGALMGRKLASRANVTRAGSAMRSWGRTASQREDIDRAQDDVGSLQEKLTDLEEGLKSEIDKVKDELNVHQLQLQELAVRPRKADIAVDKVALVWRPWRVDPNGIAEPAW